MEKPISFRMQIPFFIKKSEIDFQKDLYERFDDMVVRHIALHLADDIWGAYPFQTGFDFITRHLQNKKNVNILELGCGVGRMIGTLAKKNPAGNFWGIDYSYQMLKQGHDFWVEKKTILLDLSHKGFSSIRLPGHELKNLNFGLAKAEELPFQNESQDFVFSNFLLDRLKQPLEGLKEMQRVLKPDGKIIIVTPLNFLHKDHWEQFYPSIKLFQVIKNMGFDILEWEDEFTMEEPLDLRGNILKWNCLGMVLAKS
ncbi:MAG: ubiquinone/menaquinone biosynthesis C-methylase UbiE [Granulosicoccus sp.]|jgi:ubiquinone/menaquinone biosynthesis C-methylase UbiE